MNTIAASVSFALLGLDRNFLIQAIANIFLKKQDVIQLNNLAAEKAFGLVKPVFGLNPLEKQERI